MSGTNDQGTPRGEQAGRLPSLEEQTPGLDTDVVEQTDTDAQAFFGGEGGQVEQGAVGDGQRGDAAGRLPSLEEQTPGLDADTVASTDADAKAFFGGQGSGASGQGRGASGQGSGASGAQNLAEQVGAAGDGEDQPPAGDVRTAYENERRPGQAKPQGNDR